MMFLHSYVGVWKNKMDEIRDMEYGSYPEGINLCIISAFIIAFIFFGGLSVAKAQDSEYFRMGVELANKGDYDNAEIALLKAIQLDSRNANAFYVLGLVYAYKDMDDEAIEVLKEAVALNEKMPMPHYTLGMLYEKKGLIEEAITEWESFVNLSNNADLILIAEKHLQRLNKKKINETE